MKNGSVARTEHYTYLCFHLATRRLDDDCRRRLEQFGIECVQEGGWYRAYGIIGNDNGLIGLIAKDPDVEQVSVGSPPSGF